jgi:hypothetical protein
VEHRRLAQLYAMATQCYAAGRLEDAFGYADAARLAIDSGRFDSVPYDFESWLGGPYIWTGVPERWLELCRNMIAQHPDVGYFAEANLAVALTFTGAGEEALAVSEHLAAAEATGNPLVLCYTLVASGQGNAPTRRRTQVADYSMALVTAA